MTLKDWLGLSLAAAILVGLGWFVFRGKSAASQQAGVQVVQQHLDTMTAKEKRVDTARVIDTALVAKLAGQLKSLRAAVLKHGSHIDTVFVSVTDTLVKNAEAADSLCTVEVQTADQRVDTVAKLQAAEAGIKPFHPLTVYVGPQYELNTGHFGGNVVVPLHVRGPVYIVGNLNAVPQDKPALTAQISVVARVF